MEYEQPPRRRELLKREGQRYEVVVYFIKRSNLVLLSLTDYDRGETLECAIEPDEVMDAFEHPYAYVAQQGMKFRPAAIGGEE